MALPVDAGLYIFEIIAYFLVAPIVVYLTIRHGKRGILGFLYLNASCGIRIAADIVNLTSTSSKTAQPSMASAIIGSVGLSPLLLALAGMMHETHVYLLETSATRTQNMSRMKKWLWFAQLKIHGAVILGMILVIVGTIKLDASSSLTKADTNEYDKIRSAGIVIILIVWLVLLQYALFLGLWTRKSMVSNSIASLATWLLPAVGFVGLRVIYTVVFAFDHTDLRLNPVTGALWVKVIFITLAPLCAVVSMIVAGWQSRHIKQIQTSRKGSDEAVTYQQVLTK